MERTIGDDCESGPTRQHGFERGEQIGIQPLGHCLVECGVRRIHLASDARRQAREQGAHPRPERVRAYRQSS